jgi:anti-sigma regulatory factor (Ser/Thr protein kinase)
VSLPPQVRGWQEAWRHQDYLELAAVPEAVPAARHHVRAILREWQLPTLAYEAELVTSELAANAIDATRLVPWVPKTPPVRMWLLAEGDMLMLAVWDAVPGVPVPKAPDADDLTGRGLMIISELADWGFYPAPQETGGKVVWTRLPKAQATPATTPS